MKINFHVIPEPEPNPKLIPHRPNPQTDPNFGHFCTGNPGENPTFFIPDPSRIRLLLPDYITQLIMPKYYFFFSFYRGLENEDDPDDIDEAFVKYNEKYEEYKKILFDKFSDLPDEEQANTYVESSKISDQVTKLKIKIYRYKRQFQ